MGKTPTPLTRPPCFVAPASSPTLERKKIKQPRLSFTTRIRSISVPETHRDEMPRRKRPTARPLDVPALEATDSGDEHRVVVVMDDATVASPHSIQKSLAETNLDMNGNVRQRKGNIGIGGRSASFSETEVTASPKRLRNMNAEDYDADRVVGPAPPASDDGDDKSEEAANEESENGGGSPMSDTALHGLSGAQLWVHRIVATHHHTLHKLGLERADFPNTRLSLKQLEVLLSPVIAMCNMMAPSQFGIQTPPPHIARTMKQVHYWKLWESDTIDMGIFFMPPNSVIPLHNHPGMSVVTRVLYGSAQVTSYDLVEQSKLRDVPDTDETREVTADKKITWARVSREGEYVNNSTMWLDPRRFNLHQIQANDSVGCALLDIMIPPYDNADRDCHHFDIVAEHFLEQSKERIVKMIESIEADNHNEPTGSQSMES
ncbi:hypothetical protein Poli38472_009021 [Pythium oligandrum]|uniref:Uncharacterized protein n=1 Tax=Pythium oligandrum TaxID=41045 RepID=A0A8K1CJS4_PYTOL|nr:hypothetical protein Poli38472_009021 [Pythium oligandrum]|eukprot:TMW64854.1 hypothetical protein Poli38472_009021 [Pythium oligandrum]